MLLVDDAIDCGGGKSQLSVDLVALEESAGAAANNLKCRSP
jgi:hypothetical protein